MQLQFNDEDFISAAKWLAEKFDSDAIQVGSKDLENACAAAVMCRAIMQGSVRLQRVLPPEQSAIRPPPGLVEGPTDEPDGQD